MPETEQIANAQPLSGTGAGPADPAALASGPLTSGLAFVADLAAQFVRFTAAMTLVLALAGTLCAGLFMAARQFSHAAKSSRHAVQSPRSIQSLSSRLRSVAGDPETTRQREAFRRDIEAVCKQLNLVLPLKGGSPLPP